MTFIVSMVALGLLVTWVRHRIARKSALAGLDSTRPVFSVDPPARRMAPRKGERL